MLGDDRQRGLALARLIADLQHLLVLVKGLPLAYNRDLQDDKVALFDAHDTVAACLELMAPLVRQTRFRKDVVAARLEDGFLDATTLMELFVSRGVPMRAAHEAVGKLAGMRFEETGPMPAAEWTETFGPFDEEGRRIPFDEHPLTEAVRRGRAGHFVQRFSTAGGGP